MRLIDADKLIPYCRSDKDCCASIKDDCPKCSQYAVDWGEIMDEPVVEAELKEHGVWIDTHDPFIAICSHCNTEVYVGYYKGKTNYCPHCGVKMS